MTPSALRAAVLPPPSSDVDSVQMQVLERTARHAVARSSYAHHLGSIARAEIRFVILVSVGLCMVTSLPYAVGRLTRIPGKSFSGVLVHSLDFNNYFAYANQSAEGRWIFRNPMTAEPHSSVFFNLEWLAMGKIAAGMHVSLATALDILRLICLFLMCFGVYWLSSFLLRSTLARKSALVAIMTGGGFGWIAALHLVNIPVNSSYFLDLTNANLFPFYWALKLPHFLISECLVVLGFCFFLRGEHDLKRRDFVAAGVCYITAGACRPYDMLFAMTVTLLYLAVSWWRRSEKVTAVRLLPALMCMPALAYFDWIFKLHPVFKWWSLPGNPAPALWLLMLGYGLSFLLWLTAAWLVRRRQLTGPQEFTFCCLFTALSLAYGHRFLHFSFQFSTNILVPMVLIGFAGLEDWISRFVARHPHARKAIAALLILNCLTSISLTAQAMLLARKGDFHVDSQLIESFSWLDSHSHPNDVVFADFDLSSQIPQYTKDVVFCGYANTVELKKKLDLVSRFLEPRTANEFRAQLLQTNAVHFVLLSTAEDHSLDLGRASFLRLVFQNQAVVIFSVQYSAESGSTQAAQP